MVTRSAFRFITPARRRWLGLLAALALIGAGWVPGERVGPLLPLSAVGSDAVTVPEHPEGASFDPNEIKDIQVADVIEAFTTEKMAAELGQTAAARKAEQEKSTETANA